jgi:hypothetical protein
MPAARRPDPAAKAREVHQQITAAHRARDPVKLDKALRTVEAAPRLTADQVARLRALLPAVDDTAVA